MSLLTGIFDLEPQQEVVRISDWLHDTVLVTLNKRGLVVGLSGGVDSSVVASLAVRALGKDRVFGIFMPERHSSEESLGLGQGHAESLGIDTIIEDISSALEGIGCYRRQIEAIRRVFGEYDEGWKCKLTLSSLLAGDRLNVHRLTVQSPTGDQQTARLPLQAYLQLVAATNFKQRVRKNIEYYHADRLNYAVAGTPNRLEHILGFFVKQGDGEADVKPIAHLYKSQVYALAEALGVSDEIIKRPPTTDTYSLPQTQEEFFFALPYACLDKCLYASDKGLTPAETAMSLGMTTEQVSWVFRDIQSKQRGAHYLQAPAQSSGPMPAWN